MDIQRYSIKLDMKSVGPVDTGIRLKQGDAGMVLDFYIYSGGNLWTDSEDRPAVVFYKPDGNVVYGNANLNGNAYSYTIIGEELTAAGTARADVKFTLENGRESTRTFTFYIEPDTLGDSAHESKSVISPIEKAVTDITETYLPKVESLVTEAESYAKGGTESREGEDTDNAKYYMEEAKKAAATSTGGNKLDYKDNVLKLLHDDTELDSVEITAGANGIEFDTDTRKLSLKQGDEVIDEAEIPGGASFKHYDTMEEFEADMDNVEPNTEIHIGADVGSSGKTDISVVELVSITSKNVRVDYTLAESMRHFDRIAIRLQYGTIINGFIVQEIPTDLIIYGQYYDIGRNTDSASYYALARLILKNETTVNLENIMCKNFSFEKLEIFGIGRRN